MRLLPITLSVLLVLIQYPLWLGKGGWVRVWELDRQLEIQQQANARQVQRNAALEGEVGDLKQGLLAIEERARYELGMVRPDEVYVQINASGDPQLQRAPRPSATGREASRLDIRTAQVPPEIRTAQAPPEMFAGRVR